MIEDRYIDRDYMEDHSVFYSRSFYSFENWCRRVHFFSISKKDVRAKLSALVEIGLDRGEDAYREACRKFSEEAYLGFTVIKPLKGCPVGRTVLRALESDSGDDSQLTFESTRLYKAHLAGVELTVRGLAFQQQDVGVSACATTALWTALQKVRDFEDIRLATPAQITMLASQYTLPFGRPMPSEGLSIDQMCQAVQSLGLPPHLFKVKDFDTARAHLHSALMSGFAPVLILLRGSSYHAVTAVGVEMRIESDSALIIEGIDDRAKELAAVYIHDDRNGPYLRASLTRNIDNLELEIELDNSQGAERWTLTHILIPMHLKIRLSFVGLRAIAINIVKSIQSYRESYLEASVAHLDIQNSTIAFDTQIRLSNMYVEQLFLSREKLPLNKVNEFLKKISLARYIGLVRLNSSFFGGVDVLVDTTSTLRNLNFLGIISRSDKTKYTRDILNFLADKLECDVVL